MDDLDWLAVEDVKGCSPSFVAPQDFDQALL